MEKNVISLSLSRYANNDQNSLSNFIEKNSISLKNPQFHRWFIVNSSISSLIKTIFVWFINLSINSKIAMDCFTLLIQYNGVWEKNNEYVNYIVDAIVVNFDFDFEDLTISISTQIDVDSAVYFMEIKYVLADQISTILIHNNMNVRNHRIEMKKIRYIFISTLCHTERIFLKEFNSLTIVANLSVENRGSI